MLHAFTVDPEKFINSYLLLLAALPDLIDTLCTVSSFSFPAMIVYNVATRVLGTELFPQYDIAKLNTVITFAVLFSQEKPLRGKEIDTPTRPHMHSLFYAYINL